MDREEYSVVVERMAFDDEPSIEVSFGRAPTPASATLAPAARRATLPSEIDAAFQPWINAMTPPPVRPAPRAPKATPAPFAAAPMSATFARRGLAATQLPPTLDEEPTLAERGPASDLIDGKYRVEATLGSGGMGVVVAATHVHLGTTVAIKTLRPEAAIQPEMARRFLREARAASRLRSDHVCRALDVGQMPNGEPYIVMEMLHGRDLASLVHTSGPLSVADAAAYVLQACEAVAEAHALGMVHRDLKPANLMLTRRSDGTAHVKVLDFGIATSATGDVDSGLTRADVSMGSPGYMSPEQLRSAKSVDARSDIWSLGVTLYELVTGDAPFRGDSVSAIAIAVATEEPEPLIGPSAAFRAVVTRCLRKTPSERYASIADLAAALAPFVRDGASRAARIASAVNSAIPETLMPTDLVVARAAAAATARREAPALCALTAMPAAPVFMRAERLGTEAESTQRMSRASRRRVPALIVATIAAAALALAAYAKLSAPIASEPAPVLATTVTAP